MGRGVRARCLPGTAPPLEPFSPPRPPARAEPRPREARLTARRGGRSRCGCAGAAARAPGRALPGPTASRWSAQCVAFPCAGSRRAARAAATAGMSRTSGPGSPSTPSARRCAALRRTAHPPPPSSRTKWTRRVPHPVLIGHAALQSAALRRTALQSAALCTEPLYNERPVRRRQRRALTGARAQGCGCTCYLEGGLELG